MKKSKNRASKKVLILGASGMLGQTLMNEFRVQGDDVLGVARAGTDLELDISQPDLLLTTLNQVDADIIINCVAIVSLAECQKDPANAYRINAKPSKMIAKYCQIKQKKYVYISTDHFFTGTAGRKNRETDKVVLCNEYAKTKYQGELYSLVNKNALVVRTNIVGFRYKKEVPTFAEWAIGALMNEENITAFHDYYTSSIDVKCFSKCLVEILEKNVCGILNLACSQVSSKLQFLAKLADCLGIPPNNTRISPGSIQEIKDGIKRNENLGLDVKRAETLLEYELPNLNQVIQSLVAEYQRTGKRI